MTDTSKTLSRRTLLASAGGAGTGTRWARQRWPHAFKWSSSKYGNSASSLGW